MHDGQCFIVLILDLCMYPCMQNVKWLHATFRFSKYKHNQNIPQKNEIFTIKHNLTSTPYFYFTTTQLSLEIIIPGNLINVITHETL